MTDKKDQLRLKIDAHVIQQLGAELITGPETAIIELIKNAHDADATRCIVDVDTAHKEIINGIEYVGKLTVYDNGHGMTRDVIDRSWLTVSYSNKREAKEKKLKTKLNRSYMGDKGLGRLGSMQLGSICKISTYHSPVEDGLMVSFSWDDFKHGQVLENIKIDEKRLSPSSTGTILEIIGLRDSEYWSNEISQKQLTLTIASMVSPHGQIQNFKVIFKQNGTELDTTVFSERILNQNSSLFSFNVSQEFLELHGKVDLLTYRPSRNDSDKVELYRRHIVSDKGLNLLKFLQTNNNLKEYSLKHIDGKYFLEFNYKISLKDIDDFSSTMYSHPGLFDGKIYNFILERESLDIKDISFGDIRNTIKNVTGGIAAYRDGFRIGSNKKIDWLNLSKEMTSGAGSYSLRPTNVTGYINLTWENNSNLKEKSDRESFVENKEYHTFFMLCQHILSAINGFLNNSRRNSLLYLSSMADQEANKPKGYSAREAALDIGRLAINGKVKKNEINEKIEKIENIFSSRKNEIDRAIDKNKNDLFNDPILNKELISIKQIVLDLEQTVNITLKELHSFAENIASHLRTSEKILEEIDGYEKQIKNFYDHVAIGLSAQTLAHEANSQVTNIRLHLNDAIRRIKDLGVKDIALTKATNNIGGDVQVLSKSISSLNPLVRSQREKLENINIIEFINDYFDLRVKYFNAKGININIFNVNDNSRCILFNRGKLFQVIDNIVRNSEHWLGVFQVHYPNDEYLIKISLDKNKITIWDSARGIREPLEDVLFDMFATDKENGQGLGLFIVKTLLEERGCSVCLLQERNKFGRRFKFEIDLTEAVI